MKLVACPDVPKEDIGKIICIAGATVCPFCGKALPGRHKKSELKIGEKAA